MVLLTSWPVSDLHKFNETALRKVWIILFLTYFFMKFLNLLSDFRKLMYLTGYLCFFLAKTVFFNNSFLKISIFWGRNFENQNGGFQNGVPKSHTLNKFSIWSIYSWLIYSRKNIFKGVFGVLEHESVANFGKFKKADPRWQAKQAGVEFENFDFQHKMWSTLSSKGRGQFFFIHFFINFFQKELSKNTMFR